MIELGKEAPNLLDPLELIRERST